MGMDVCIYRYMYLKYSRIVVGIAYVGNNHWEWYIGNYIFGIIYTIGNYIVEEYIGKISAAFWLLVHSVGNES